MATTQYGGGAKIYSFPKGGRAGLTRRRIDGGLVQELVLPQVANVAMGSSWYHEEAVREAETTRKQ